MSKALLFVSGEFLRQVLLLPQGTTVHQDMVTILVEHPDIPPTAKTVTPEFRTEWGVDGRTTKFVHWGAE